MARKKRHSTKTAPSSGKRANSAKRAAPSAMKPRRSLKGRVEYVEIDSEEERPKRHPPLKSVLAGLDPNVVLAPTQPTIELSDDDETHDDGDGNDVGGVPPKAVRQSGHETRGSRYGKAPALTNLKYHPMDEVLFPSRAARHRSGSQGKSVSVKVESDGETSEDSLRTLPGDSESEDNESEADDDDHDIPVVSQRVPDPKAIRHSARSEAQKVVSYSRKYHPQDYALVGHRSKAKAAIRAEELLPPMKTKKRKSAEAVMEDLGPSHHEGSEAANKPMSSPRKKLRSTASGSPSAIKAREKPQSRKRGPGQKHGKRGSTMKLGDMDSVELAAFLSEAAQGSQERPLSVSDDQSEEESDPDDPSADLELLPGSQSSPQAPEKDD
ncbi:hypothetical protein B0A55_12455, partial [Friedmanniomyces simplex]